MAKTAEKIEHSEQNAIVSLNRLEHDRGRIPSKDLRLAVYKWFEYAHPEDQKQIAFVLTGKEDGAINNEKPDVNLFLYYLWTQFSADLHEAVRMFQASDEREQRRIAAAITGNPDGKIDFKDSEIKQRFLEFYEERTELGERGQMARAFKTLRLRFSTKEKYEDEDGEFKPEKFDEEPIFDPKLSSTDDILGEIYSARNAAKKEMQDTARRNLIIQMSRLDSACKNYGLTPSDLLKTVIENPEILFAPDQINIGPFGADLRTLLKAIDDKKKAEEKARKDAKEVHDERVKEAKRAHDRGVKDKRERIAKRLQESPVSGDLAVFICMREELEALGNKGEDLGALTAENFAKFSVWTLSRDFGGHKVEKCDSFFDPAKYGSDIRRMRDRIRPSEVLRGSGEALLAQFPYFEKLGLKSPEHDIRHRFEKIDPKGLAEFIAIINHEVLKREESSRAGITVSHLAPLQKIVRILEDLLAEKLAAKIGNSEDAWKKAAEVLRVNLREPFRHVEAYPDKVIVHLRSLKPPKEEHKESDVIEKVKKGLNLAGVLGSIWSGLEHFVDGWGGKKTKAPEKPAGKPEGHH